MKSQHQLFAAAVAAAGALALHALVEAHGGPHQVGAHLGLQLHQQAIHTIATGVGAKPWVR